jgi:hypothetical protein
VGNGDGVNKGRIYIQFDLSEIPTTAVVTEAELHLWYRYTTADRATTVNAYQVTGSWAENTITWDNQPPYSSTLLQGSASIAEAATSNFVNWDLRVALVKGWLDGSMANHGLVLIDADEDTLGAWKGFCSSDIGTAAERPKLVITYYNPADP